MATCEVCPDCQRPLAVSFGDGGCLAQCADIHFRTDALCKKLTIRRLRAELEALKAPAVWVSVKELMPATYAKVYAFDESEVVPAYWSGNFWWAEGDGPALESVTHWCPRYVPPLPTPPKEPT